LNERGINAANQSCGKQVPKVGGKGGKKRNPRQEREWQNKKKTRRHAAWDGRDLSAYLAKIPIGLVLHGDGDTGFRTKTAQAMNKLERLKGREKKRSGTSKKTIGVSNKNRWDLGR